MLLRVAAFVHQSLSANLRRLLGPLHSLSEADSWQGLEGILLTRRVDVIVVDPAAADCGDRRALDVILAYPCLPVVAYTTLSANVADTILTLSKANVRRFLIHPFEGPASVFQGTLALARSDSPSTRLLSAIACRLDLLPKGLRNAVQELFYAPERFSTSSDIALLGNASVKTMHRRFADAGLRSPKSVLVAARLLRLRSTMSDPARSIESSAAALGYRHPRVLRIHTIAALRVSPRSLAGMSETEVIDRLAEWIAI